VLSWKWKIAGKVIKVFVVDPILSIDSILWNASYHNAISLFLRNSFQFPMRNRIGQTYGIFRGCEFLSQQFSKIETLLRKLNRDTLLS
jgi:hypothetical protein